MIYRVESRHEFDNCQLNESNKVFTFECDDRPNESEMTTGMPVNALLAEKFEEKKEYFFLSVSSDCPTDRLDGVCYDFVPRFSIKIDTDVDEYLNVDHKSP